MNNLIKNERKESNNEKVIDKDESTPTLFMLYLIPLLFIFIVINVGIAMYLHKQNEGIVEDIIQYNVQMSYGTSYEEVDLNSLESSKMLEILSFKKNSREEIKRNIRKGSFNLSELDISDVLQMRLKDNKYLKAMSIEEKSLFAMNNQYLLNNIIYLTVFMFFFLTISTVVILNEYSQILRSFDNGK